MKPENFKLKIEIYADGANLAEMMTMADNPRISGLTTNPTLMRKAGIDNYSRFAKDVLKKIRDKPISFEVFSDDLLEMKMQGIEIASWGENVYVKVPITNTKGESTKEVIEYLVDKGVKVNVTAIFTVNQVREIVTALDPTIPSCLSIFAGRIADTGRDPIPLVQEVLKEIEGIPSIKLIWASPRELLNIFQASEIGCHIITATSDILNQLEFIGKDLEEFSLETVKMFYLDALSSGYTIEERP